MSGPSNASRKACVWIAPIQRCLNYADCTCPSHRSAGIISVALVGWLSLIAFVAHAASAQCPAEHGYLGAVPYKYWLVGLPGILLGSMVGRKINQLIGSRNVVRPHLCRPRPA